MGVTSACWRGEMCAVRSLAFPSVARLFRCGGTSRRLAFDGFFLLQSARLTLARIDLHLRQFSFSLAQVFSG
jgi:hypothetical protein